MCNLLGGSGGKATRKMWFQQDGGCAQFAHQFQDNFISIYDDRWNEQGGPMA